MFTYLLNKNFYGFQISSAATDLDIKKMQENGVIFFESEEDFKKEWGSKLEIAIEDLEGIEYQIIKDKDGKTVVVCDRGFLMDNDKDNIEDFIIEYEE